MNEAKRNELNMSVGYISDRVIAQVADICKITTKEVQDDKSLRCDYGMDSLDVVELEMYIEDDTGIRMADGSLEECETVGDVKDTVFHLYNDSSDARR